MAAAKIIVLYPRPKDIDAFEKAYAEEHVPMVISKMSGKTRFIASKIVATPQEAPAFYRTAEVHFPSMKALEACAASEGGKETVAHAIKISSGGPPILMIAEEEVFTF